MPNPNVFFDPAPFDYLARQHYDLVIAGGYVGGLSEAARRFPGVKFVALDAARGQLYPLRRQTSKGPSSTPSKLRT